jgi:hypothetical protein
VKSSPLPLHGVNHPFRPQSPSNWRWLPAFLLWLLLFGGGEAIAATNLGHPRLYFSTNDLPALRAGRSSGTRALIWRNLAESADWCLTRPPRAKWIAPVSPDPRYENLYDRFYAIMADLAITEHLAFAYAFSGDARYGEAARQWVLASCRAWQAEADAKPDSGKAYAVSRFLKGVAVGYDIAFDRFTEAERTEIRATLTRVGRKYFAEWFTLPGVTGPGYHTHHAIVEWASFGVVALALIEETPEARLWLDATVRKFEEHLLPLGLSEDGAQVEGTTFWASTMQYRLFFMDALRHVTGRDLYRPFARNMNADLALAGVACRKRPGLDEHHANVVLAPAYGQLDYSAPVLLALAREYRRPLFQHVARWDESLGALQRTRYITPHGEELIFELGGYAYLWCDDSVPAQAETGKLSWSFPSVDEAYVRTSWRPGDLMAGGRKGEIVVHAGGRAVLIQPAVSPGPTNLLFRSLTDDGRTAVARFGDTTGHHVILELDRREQRLLLRRQVDGDWSWWCHDAPVRRGNVLVWTNGVTLTVKSGSIGGVEEKGFAPPFAVGNNLLDLLDPIARPFPLIRIVPPSTGETIVELRHQPR